MNAIFGRPKAFLQASTFTALVEARAIFMALFFAWDYLNQNNNSVF